MGPQYANKIESLLLAVMDGNQVVATSPSVQTEDKIKPFRKRYLVCSVSFLLLYPSALSLFLSYS